MFRYQEKTKANIPRFPTFVRSVKDEKAEAVIAEAKKSPRKKVAKKKSAAAKQKPMPSGSRYFELVDDNSSKFWEISINKTEVTVRYGKINTNGTVKTKDLGSETEAQKHLEKQIHTKVGKGYLES